MSEVAHNAPEDFWRPPAAGPVALEPNIQSGMVEVCDRCETEFIAGSRFCHVCGATRSSKSASHVLQNWARQALGWVHHLEFHNIERWIVNTRQRLGLPTMSLAAFAVGLGCLLFAVGVGLFFSVRTTLDWEAGQVWRIQWLLGASASFLAGILLEESSS